MLASTLKRPLPSLLLSRSPAARLQPLLALATSGPTTPARGIGRVARGVHRSGAVSHTRTGGGGGGGGATGTEASQGERSERSREESERRRRSPRELVAHLNQYVVGQEKAKKVLAVATYNHYARLAQLSSHSDLASGEPAPPSGAQVIPTSRPVTAAPLASLMHGWVEIRPSAKQFKALKESLKRVGVAIDLGNLEGEGAKPKKGKKAAKKEKEEAEAEEGDESKDKAVATKKDGEAEEGVEEAKPAKSTRKRRTTAEEDDETAPSNPSRRFYRTADDGLAIIESPPSTPLTDIFPIAQRPSIFVINEQDVPLSGPGLTELSSRVIPWDPSEDKLPKEGDEKKSPSSSKQDRPPVDDLPSPSDLLTDFLGQHPGQPLPPRQSASSQNPLFEKSNVLLLGPTGSGKSLLVRTLARVLDVPFASAEATSMTSAGYVGEDVENCIARLLEAADGDVEKASRGIVFIDEIDKISSSRGLSKDVGGEGVQQALLKMLEGTSINVSEYGYNPPSAGMFGMRRGPMREAVIVDTTNILFIVAGAFVGLEKIIQSRLAKGSIGFTSRIAPTPSQSINSPDSATTFSPSNPSTFLSGTSGKGADGKQQDLSHLLDQCEPDDLALFGLIPEFIGRIPITAALKTLTEADLLRVLQEPKNALVKQYTELFAASGVQLLFTTPALRAVAALAVKKQTGARGLRRIMEQALLDSMYEVPNSSIQYVLITAEVVNGKAPAKYYSRSQKHMFELDYTAEEEAGEEAEGGAAEKKRAAA
ncbi:ATP-binding protein [Rhodotorula toruloides]